MYSEVNDRTSIPSEGGFIMSDVTTQATSETTSSQSKRDEAGTSIVDTIFDLGFGWAATGLKLGKTALEQSAKTLVQTAKALETLAAELEKKEHESKS
jgi:hypothetical protein